MFTPPKTLADLMPGKPFKELPLPRCALHDLGLNPGRKTVYWPQIEDKGRWDSLVDKYGSWACRRASSFSPLGDWGTLESRSESLYQTVLARM